MSAPEYPFHLAFAVSDLAATRDFFTDVLGCRIGRTNERWIDFDFFGHQLTAHLKADAQVDIPANEVDGEQVPVRHFGIILDWDHWQELSDELQQRKINFIIEPTIRFANQPGEQATMFIEDPSGNALEFKAFKRDSMIFSI